MGDSGTESLAGEENIGTIATIMIPIVRQFTALLLICLLAVAPLQGVSATMDIPVTNPETCHDLERGHPSPIDQGSTSQDCEHCASQLMCDKLCCAQGHCMSGAAALPVTLASGAEPADNASSPSPPCAQLSQPHYSPYRPPRA